MLSIGNLSRRLRATRNPLALELAGNPDNSLLNLPARISEPVIISCAELLKRRSRYIVRLRSPNGAVGVALAHERVEYLWPLLTRRVLPLVVGQDARQVEALVDAVARYDSNYKFAGLPFWTCVAAVEFAMFDLLGKAVGQAAGELLGGALRQEIPIYLSSLRRETSPAEECSRLARRLAETGATAVKFKIGGRMGRSDVAPRRTKQLVELARKVLGSGITILVDANGSYTSDQAIEVGRMLESHEVSVYEEPCAWEDFEATREVADRLQEIRVAGGEQDSSAEKFRWLFRNRGLDIVQPDVVNNGGFIRTLRVARLAAQNGIPVSYHCPRSDYLACSMLHMASVTPNLWPFQELLEAPPAPQNWYAPHFHIQEGKVAVPQGAGLGMTIDPAELARACVVK